MTVKIGVLTSGGDAPGMNAAVRAVVRAAINVVVCVVMAVQMRMRCRRCGAGRPRGLSRTLRHAAYSLSFASAAQRGQSP